MAIHQANTKIIHKSMKSKNEDSQKRKSKFLTKHLVNVKQVDMSMFIRKSEYLQKCDFCLQPQNFIYCFIYPINLYQLLMIMQLFCHLHRNL